jgi:hypothetical protein
VSHDDLANQGTQARRSGIILSFRSLEHIAPANPSALLDDFMIRGIANQAVSPDYHRYLE